MQTLALILQTEWKIRAVLQFVLEHVLRVKMSRDKCVIILLYYSETSISIYFKGWLKAKPDRTSLLQYCLFLPNLISVSSVYNMSVCIQRTAIQLVRKKKRRKNIFLIFVFLSVFAFLLQVFQLWTPSVPAEADLGGVGGGLKDQEAGQSLEGKDVGASRQRAALQLWQERWLVQQLHLQQRMLLMVTVFLKVSEYCLLRIQPKGWMLVGHVCTKNPNESTYAAICPFYLHLNTFLSQTSILAVDIG